MKSIVKSRNLYRVITALKDAGETGIGCKDKAYIGIADVWSDNNTGQHKQIAESANKNLVPRASIL